MARAAAAGMVTVRGECLPLTETMPLLPVAGALRELARVDGGGVMAAALDEVPGRPQLLGYAFRLAAPAGLR